MRFERIKKKQNFQVFTEIFVQLLRYALESGQILEKPSILFTWHLTIILLYRTMLKHHNEQNPLKQQAYEESFDPELLETVFSQ